MQADAKTRHKGNDQLRAATREAANCTFESRQRKRRHKRGIQSNHHTRSKPPLDTLSLPSIPFSLSLTFPPSLSISLNLPHSPSLLHLSPSPFLSQPPSPSPPFLPYLLPLLDPSSLTLSLLSASPCLPIYLSPSPAEWQRYSPPP